MHGGDELQGSGTGTDRTVEQTAQDSSGTQPHATVAEAQVPSPVTFLWAHGEREAVCPAPGQMCHAASPVLIVASHVCGPGAMDVAGQGSGSGRGVHMAPCPGQVCGVHRSLDW